MWSWLGFLFVPLAKHTGNLLTHWGLLCLPWIWAMAFHYRLRNRKWLPELWGRLYLWRTTNAEDLPYGNKLEDLWLNLDPNLELNFSQARWVLKLILWSVCVEANGSQLQLWTQIRPLLKFGNSFFPSQIYMIIICLFSFCKLCKSCFMSERLYRLLFGTDALQKTPYCLASQNGFYQQLLWEQKVPVPFLVTVRLLSLASDT